MARDHALLESAHAGAPPSLRLYRWRPACLSFGRNQHVQTLYAPAVLAGAGIDVVRRPTGGLAVLHDCELTYSVAGPVSALGSPRTAYRRINEALLEAMRALGVPASLSGTTAARGPRTHAPDPCFQEPAAGEVTAGGRKLVGSAQRRERASILQHGSILVDGSQDRVRRMLRREADDVSGDVSGAGDVALSELLGAAPGWDELCDVVTRGFAAVFGTRFAPATLTRQEAERADRLEELYTDDTWTWRR